MGYRSDVAYKIWFEDVNTRDAFIDMVLANHDASLYKALKECEIGMEEVDGEMTPVISYHGEDLKWYDDFPDVKMHHDLMKFAELVFEEHCGVRFVRMGESDDDIVYEHCGRTELIGYDNLYVRRELIHGEVENALTLAEWREKQTQTT